MNKETLRKVYLGKRLTLTNKERSRRNQSILDQIFTEFPFRNTQYIHIFLSIESKGEVNTWPIIERLEREYPGINIVIPKVGKGNKLHHYRFKADDEIVLNNWSIPEPSTGEEISPQKLDLVFVPLICFDRKGHRIGYGKGYYDRFLKECREDTLKVGLSLAPPLDLIPYSDTFDIPLNRVVYPGGVLKNVNV